MVVFLDREGYTDTNCIVPVSKYLFRAATRRIKGLRLESTYHPRLAATVVLTVFDSTTKETIYTETFKPIDEKFPDWRQVVPDIKKPDGDLAFDARYLGDFAKITAAAFGTKGSAGIRLVGNGEGPALITAYEDDWFGVLMPVRMSAGTRPPFSISVERAVAA